MAIADVMTWRGRDPAAAIRAWERVLERFAGAQQAVIAADKLAGAHPERALDLALRSGKDALVCHALRRALVREGASRAAAARAAEGYLREHPRSDCRNLAVP
jgi:hypothetical protein